MIVRYWRRNRSATHLPQLREMTDLSGSLNNRLGCRETRYCLNNRAHVEFRFCVFKISGDGVSRDADDTRGFPGRFSLSGPFETLEFAGRQRHAIDDTVGSKFAAGMCVKIHRHQLKY